VECPTLRTTRNESPLGHDGSQPGGERFRGQGPKGAVRSLVIVLPTPVVSQGFRFSQVGEALGVQELIPEAGVEGFSIAVLPRRPRFHEEGADSGLLEPGVDGLRDELGSVVGADVGGHPAGLHDADEFVDHVLCGDAPFAEELGALPGVLVEDGEPFQ